MANAMEPTISSNAYPDDDVWRVLEFVAYHQGRDEEPDELVDLLRGADFDHGRLVEQSLRHGLTAALADFVFRHRLHRSLPGWMQNSLLSYRSLSEHRARLLTDEAVTITASLERAGIRAAWTKGAIVQSTLYDSTFVRMFNDVDLMIDPGDRGGVEEALVSLGYRPRSTFDPVTGELRDLSRAKQIIYQLNPDHLPHFYRLIDDLCVPVLCVDVANSLTWHNSDWQVPMDAVLAEIWSVEVVGGARLPSLSPAHSFLFLCLHLFREGWVERFVQSGDVSLAQFVDIARAWLRSSAEVRARVRADLVAFDLAEPVAWVCGHTDALFGSEMVAELGLTAFAGRDWLASAQGGGGRRLTWSGDMRERLRDPRPTWLAPADGQG